MIAPDPAVLRAWRADDHPFHAVVLLFASEPLRDRIDSAAAALRGLLEPVATPHVTLHVSGPARPVVARERVAVQVGGADSFASAPFLHVSGHRLRPLRAELQTRWGFEVGGTRDWVPHVTVGTFRMPTKASRVADLLGPLRDLPPLRVIGRLAVVTVDRRTGGLRIVDGRA